MANWIDAEIYFYGEIANKAGENQNFISIATCEYGVVSIKKSKSFIESYDKKIGNSIGIRAKAKQSLEGEIDFKSLKFVEFVEYSQDYDKNYLDFCRTKAKIWIEKIDVEEYLNEVRGR